MVTVVGCVKCIGVGFGFVWVGRAEHCCVIVLSGISTDIFIRVVAKSMACSTLNFSTVLEFSTSIVCVGFVCVGAVGFVYGELGSLFVCFKCAYKGVR